MDADQRTLSEVARRAAKGPHVNQEELVMAARIDAARLRLVLCPVVRLLACLNIRRPALQKMLADYVHGRPPGGPGSLLQGESADNLARIRSRLTRELLTAVRLHASAEPRVARAEALHRLGDFIESSLRGSSSPDREESAQGEALTQNELLRAWVGVNKEAGSADSDFLIPSISESVLDDQVRC
jgi:hypothetical protein